MKRGLWCISVAAGLIAGCAHYPVSESQALVSGIARHRSSNIYCGIGGVRYCEVDVVDKSKVCSCMDSRALFGPQ
jgi:hypothetical protein